LFFSFFLGFIPFYFVNNARWRGNQTKPLDFNLEKSLESTIKISSSSITDKLSVPTSSSNTSTKSSFPSSDLQNSTNISRPNTCDRGNIKGWIVGKTFIYDFFSMDNEKYIGFVTHRTLNGMHCIFQSKEETITKSISTGYLWGSLSKCIIPESEVKQLRDNNYLDFSVSYQSNLVDVRVCLYPEEKKHYVSNCLIYRNDENILNQFIQWNTMVGMEHFYMYDHLSVDNTNEKLKPYIDSGLVTYHSWRNYRPEPHTIETYHIAQDTALLSCLNRYRDKNVWIWVGDTDEFIYPVKGENFTYLLKQQENSKYDAFRVHGYRWQDDPAHPLPLIPDPKKMTKLVEPYPLNMTFPQKYQFESLEVDQSTFKLFVKINQVEQSGLHDLNGAGNSLNADENLLVFNHYRMERYGRPNDRVKFNPVPYQRIGWKIKCC